MDEVTVALLSEPFMFIPKVSQKFSSRKYFPWENAVSTEFNPPGGNLSTLLYPVVETRWVCIRVLSSSWDHWQQKWRFIQGLCLLLLMPFSNYEKSFFFFFNFLSHFGKLLTSFCHPKKSTTYGKGILPPAAHFMVQMGTSFLSQWGNRPMIPYQRHQHGSKEDHWVGFSPQDSSKWPTAFARLTLGNVHFIITKHIKQQVPGSATYTWCTKKGLIADPSSVTPEH